MNIALTVEDAAAKAVLAKLLRAGQDMTPFMRTVAAEFESRVEGRFESKRDPNGVRWLDLRPATLKRKKGRGSLLVFTGDMQDSLNSRFGADFAEVGFGAPYAAFHEFGAPKRKSPMSRRGLLFGDPVARTLGADDLAYVVEQAEEHLADAIRGA